jgi:hypothetical protein
MRGSHAPAIYGATGFLCPVAFWLLGRTGSPALDDVLFCTQVAPFALLALGMGAARCRVHPGAAADLLAAVLWSSTLLAFALWHPLVQARVGLLACTAATLGLAGSALLARFRGINAHAPGP